MDKLGFAIKLASNGVAMPIVCNRGQWTNKVVDIRDFLKLCNGLADIEQTAQVSTGNSATFISFDEGGCFLVQFKALSGRVGDFLSGWIYIPRMIDATGEDVMNAHNYVRNILSQSNLNDIIGDIEAFFSKEYPKKEFTAQYTPSSGEEFGVRFNGYYSMKEILDVDRYQPYYSKYKAIFLLDKDGEVKIAKDQVSKFRDLTKLPIDKTCIFKAPSPEDVSRLGKGAKIVFTTMQEFNSPLLTKMGDRIQLFAQRDGFELFTLPTVTIQEDGQTLSIDSSSVIWEKRISSSMFSIFNSKHEKIKEGVQISINGKDITYKDALFSEEDCSQAIVKISALDYESFEQKLNLLKDVFEVTLNRKVKTFKAVVELANGNPAEMTLESKYLSSKKDSPLKGYDYEEDSQGDQILKLDSWFILKQRAWGFLAALATVILFFAFEAFDAWLDTHHFKFGLPPWEEDKSAQVYQPSVEKNGNGDVDDVKDTKVAESSEIQISPQTLEYLNNNNTWSEKVLKYDPATQGLYNMINNYRFSDLVNFNIENCDRFNQIKEISNRVLDSNFSISGTYSRDGTITIQNWIDKVKTEYDKKLKGHTGDEGSDYKQSTVEIGKREVSEGAKEDIYINGGL